MVFGHLSDRQIRHPLAEERHYPDDGLDLELNFHVPLHRLGDDVQVIVLEMEDLHRVEQNDGCVGRETEEEVGKIS